MNKKNKLIGDRKGITREQIIILVILIFSFVVIAVLIWQLALGGQVNERACMNSIVLSDIGARVPVIGSMLGNIKCKTEYYCISMGEDCKNAPLKSEKISIEKGDLENLKLEISRKIAKSWGFVGAGKYYKWLEKQGTEACAIFHVIYTDQKIQDNTQAPNQITVKNLAEFMAVTPYKEGWSYLYYIYGFVKAEMYFASLGQGFNRDRVYYLTTDKPKAVVLKIKDKKLNIDLVDYTQQGLKDHKCTYFPIPQ